MQRYNPKDIEPKWQAHWQETDIYRADDTSAKPKKYILEYFPYPSGAAMHVGHVRNYTIGDVIARFNRMLGYEVLHPMGWDAFGLPAENYAIKNKISPSAAIAHNTQRFKQQLLQMGFSYDWSREINSTDPTYYRWTQWLFLLLFKKGLAYQQESLQWWCPFDKTVLANEQVENGRCWRCDNMVEKKSLKQWFFKITDYADRLLDDLEDINWSEAIKSMQRNWIGRSSGAVIDFPTDDPELTIDVYTTRPDTIYGASFLVLAPEHPMVDSLVTESEKNSVAAYRKASQAKSEIERQETGREKTGVFSGSYVINPMTHQKIPVWIADYVLAGYGTGAIMAVPAHDERDYAFAKKFSLPIVPVVAAAFHEYVKDVVERPSVVIVAKDPKTQKYATLNWRRDSDSNHQTWPGGGIDEKETLEQAALREFVEETGYDDVTIDEIIPAATVTYYPNSVYANGGVQRSVRAIALATVHSMKHSGTIGHDDYEKESYSVEWRSAEELMASMQDEWKLTAHYALDNALFNGEGVMINSGPYNNLTSSEARDAIIDDLEKAGHGHQQVNYRMRDWLISRQRYWGAPIPIVHCKIDGAVPVAEDKLPVLLPEVENIEPSGNGESPLAQVSSFVDTTCPKCGGPARRETDTMDGFACSSWYFLRFADPHNQQQAFDKELAKHWAPVDDYIGGAEHAVMHLLYARFWTKVMQDEGLIDFGEPFVTLRNHGMILAPDGNKMSKSKGNTIEPDTLLAQGYGADSIRIMELFIGPWNQTANWSVEGMGGAHRFLQRSWTLVQEYLSAGTAENAASSQELLRVSHATVKKVSRDLELLSFNTAVAALMECVNQLFKIKAQDKYQSAEWGWTLKTYVQLLAPFAPHICEELWAQMNCSGSVHESSWPRYDEKYLQSSQMTIMVQINGKVRAQLHLPTESSEEQIVETAKQEPNVQKYIGLSDIRKTIYVPHKLVNFVIQ